MATKQVTITVNGSMSDIYISEDNEQIREHDLDDTYAP